MESKWSDHKLNPLPPDPGHHQDSAIAHSILAPRIHGELLKLGFEVAQSSVAKYMVKRCGPPSQGWRLFRERQLIILDRRRGAINERLLAPEGSPVMQPGQ